MLAVFFILWIILNGRVTLELVLLGVLIAAAVFLFAHYAFGYSASTELMIVKLIPFSVIYSLNLVAEIIKASLSVMKIIVKPSAKPDPVLVEFDSSLKSELQNVILANSITLTPGTYTVQMKGGHFMVHCLVPEYAEGIQESSFVRLLRKMEN